MVIPNISPKNIYTFNDIKEGYLKVVVSDLSLGKLVIIPDDLERIYGIHPKHFPVSTAVRMSAGFPYFLCRRKCQEKQIRKVLLWMEAY